MIGFEQLNPMQQEAVKQKDGAVLILAGAGSGKTGALTVRIADMLEKGISPYRSSPLPSPIRPPEKCGKELTSWPERRHRTCG